MADDQPSTYSRCTGAGCGKLMLWIITVGGNRMPLDPDPHPDGNVIITRLDDGSIRGRVLSGNELPAEGRIVYRPHHRTCPASAEFRRRKAATAPRCAACGLVMDLWLVDRGWRWHVNCTPEPPTTRPRIQAQDTQDVAHTPEQLELGEQAS